MVVRLPGRRRRVEVGRRVLDDVPLVRPRAVGRSGTALAARRPSAAPGDQCAVARQSRLRIEDAHAAALEALELDRVLVVAAASFVTSTIPAELSLRRERSRAASRRRARTP